MIRNNREKEVAVFHRKKRNRLAVLHGKLKSVVYVSLGRCRLGTSSNWSRITFLVTPPEESRPPPPRFKDGKDKALALYAFIAQVDDDVGDLPLPLKPGRIQKGRVTRQST